MTRVPGWGLLSSVLAPVLLIGGWTVAARLQPAGFDSGRDTISALAAPDATDRWVMTAALLGVGVCYAVTATALRPAAVAGRAMLAAGGVATVAVATFPLPSGGDRSSAHSVAAGIAFGALCAWPVLGTLTTDAGAAAGWPLRRRTGAGASATLVGLLGWFVLEMASGGPYAGLSERVTAGAQALWLLVVVVSLRATQRATAPPG